MLFRPLETFICNGDPDTSFRQLKERDNPPQLCGKVFKMGELTYSCRDCGTDPTCVLCMDCFQHSAHKKHRYKMAASGGGGYCDCGDREAWKAEPFCDVHKRGLNRQQQSPVDNLPPDLKERAEKIFMITVQCAVTLLTWKEYDSPPKHLRQEHLSDSYITVLFNDEVHTYEQVISTLQRAVGCTQKEAIELATITDREGRAMVKRGSFDECEKARVIIEKQTTRQNSRPLVTHVMHTSVVAQQTFAMRILSWLNGIIKHSDGLRQLFCQLLLAPGPDNSISFVEKILLADTQLWKGYEIHYNLFQLLFNYSVLMDPDSKRQFSVIFTQLYQRIASDFVSDDHSRKESVSSVSVQIFTVSTLARMLIAEHNLLQVTMDAFLVICQTKINKHGKFAFERQDRNAQQFKRACYMLCDFKYALAAKPSQEEWSDQLRMNFMNGFRAFVQVLRAMEGMDAVTRQTSQHIEFEPEWEQGFNLHLRLADCIALVIEWCSSDPSVLVESFNVLIEVIHAIHGKEEPRSFAAHHYTQSVVKYDVASQPVYIHLPITRLFAGLLPFLSKLNLNLQELLQKSNAKLNVLIEPSLRAQVLAAQVHAQMWRRNGYSLLNQIYFYHNVRCRTEMFDKDITLLQSAAANMDPNEFMLQVILRFGLMKWAKADSEQSSNSEESRRQLTILAEKFLNLLIIIIGERFVPGVGRVNAEDMLKREVIHQLCIKPMAHSELTKALPEDPDRDTGIEEVVKQVATFKKPTGTSGKGMYELKEECFERYNPFFYHYTRAERSKSEETQRNRKKLKGLNIALPPPCPPDFCDAFRGILRLLNCSLMHFVIALVLKRAQAKYLRCWSETQFEKILHLISLALYEEKKTQDRLEEGAQNFTEIDADRTRSGETSIYSLLKALVGHPNITPGAQNGLLTWVIEQYDAVREFYKAAV
ncbi:hypothetical protein CAPTEDRAFT_153753, partial [Capitella teleta]